MDIEAVAFDLDGTVVDSVPDLALAVDAMMVELGLAPWGEGPVRTWVGNGAPRLVKRALTGHMDMEPAADLYERAMPLFNRHYAENICVSSRLFPGVRSGLSALRALAFPLACVTNKPTAFTVPLIERLGLGQMFAVVVGGDATPKPKPAPDPLLLAADRLGTIPSRMLLVGDSINDVTSARHAGCPVFCVPYGYNHGQDIREASPDRMIESVSELPALLKRAS